MDLVGFSGGLTVFVVWSCIQKESNINGQKAPKAIRKEKKVS
jgi:hypothetical protein